MNLSKKIVVTGARGFIGSNLVKLLNQNGYYNLLLSDEIDNLKKSSNLDNTKYDLLVDRKILFDAMNEYKPEFIFHIGARTDTAEFDTTIFEKLNLNYSKEVWRYCSKYKIGLLYASSAATYGNGNLGFDDMIDIHHLEPLNPYGWSKQNFDLWAIEQTECPPFWAGLKFFNVYGPGENHKYRMASVIYHAYNCILDSNKMTLFQSHNDKYKDGEQLRDFIYVKDIVDICLYMFKNKVQSGIYNCGTGQARSFNDLVKGVFFAMNKPINIDYKPMPEDIRDKYQYFTEAKIDKLKKIGYHCKFTSLENGIIDYIQGYLNKVRLER